MTKTEAACRTRRARRADRSDHIVVCVVDRAYATPAQTRFNMVDGQLKLLVASTQKGPFVHVLAIASR